MNTYPGSSHMLVLCTNVKAAVFAYWALFAPFSFIKSTILLLASSSSSDCTVKCVPFKIFMSLTQFSGQPIRIYLTKKCLWLCKQNVNTWLSSCCCLTLSNWHCLHANSYNCSRNDGQRFYFPIIITGDVSLLCLLGILRHRAVLIQLT